ncbi:MAG: class I SAM-dependent methyltransferase [Alphaproteobacteria bacterium]|nr:class I SAM-dependent methyltransferase [Alphaproteobacteria bacterium]
MEAQYHHAMLAAPNHDEGSRQAFVVTLSRHLAQGVQPGTRLIYERMVAPALRQRSQLAPDRIAVRRAMHGVPYWQLFSSLKRTMQEMLFDSVGESVERQLPRLIARAKDQKKPLGLLQLDPAVAAPHYLAAVDIHCMPGNYHREIARDDVYAGALFDRGIYLYGMGGLGPHNDDMGNSMTSWLKKKFPGLRPRRILDLGCSAGTNTVPYVRAYPQAQVHAIDVAAPQLRYAHARAEALGAKIHFSQQNAEHTKFPSGHFDLIVAHILTHETSTTAHRNIVQEGHRLLAPGGLMVSIETNWATENDPFNQSVLDWETHYNAEPFKTKLDKIDLKAVARTAGFQESKIFFDRVPSVRAGVKYYRGQWNAFGCWK